MFYEWIITAKQNRGSKEKGKRVYIAFEKSAVFISTLGAS